jgi:hypothetical protein
VTSLAKINRADSTTRKQQIGRPFQPGLSGNPAGRPLGSRNKIPERLFKLMDQVLAEDDDKARESLRRMRDADQPKDFWRLYTSIVPKDIQLDVTGEIDVWHKVKTHRQMYEIALEHIGAERPLLEHNEQAD